LGDNIFSIIVVTGLGTWIWRAISRSCRQRKVSKISRELYDDVKRSLKNVGHGVSGLSESDILRKYLAFPRLNEDSGLQRDESTFYD